ncbi:MAG TPA: hypothetical protein VN328_09165 [Thermodesulfovibrionales bacterium]|nr:hypothetical protein [Thermodesulfovibrionales bacterium]
MFQFASVWSRFLVVCLVVVFTVTSVGCGGSSLSSEERSRLALDEGYKLLIQGVHAEALTKIKQSIELFPTQEALLLRPQVEYMLGNGDDAYKSLTEVANQYPLSGKDDFIKAIFLSLEKGDPREIRDRLITALNDNFVEMEAWFWWELIENEPSLAYFRTQPEYSEVLKHKTPAAGVITSCKQNKTGFEKHWWGPQIYIGHSKMDVFNNVTELVEVLAEFSALISPPVAAILGVVLMARRLEILSKDKGCGVVMSWTWAQFVPGVWASIISFWVSSQS